MFVYLCIKGRGTSQENRSVILHWVQLENSTGMLHYFFSAPCWTLTVILLELLTVFFHHWLSSVFDDKWQNVKAVFDAAIKVVIKPSQKQKDKTVKKKNRHPKFLRSLFPPPLVRIARWELCYISCNSTCSLIYQFSIICVVVLGRFKR